MNRFSVWAPDATQVDVIVNNNRVPMRPAAEGWWCADVNVGPGTEYSFSVNGSEPLPDPRSPYQPHGIYGPSCLVDHSAFNWTDQHWQALPLPAAIIYEVHIGTFTPEGTFDSAVSKLDHLASLGVTHIELMPVNEFSGKWGWGYDGVDLFAPHHAYGGPQALKRFVDAAHATGLAVLLDVVYNHLGPAGNYLSRFGPYFTSRHATPWGEAVNLDGPMCHHVRRFFCDNALMWLQDYHFDGLRLDAVHALIDNGAVHLLEQLQEEVEHLAIRSGRHLVLIAESDLNDPRIVRSREVGGYGMDAQWSDDFHHSLHSVLTGETAGYYADFGKIEHLAKVLKDVFVYNGCYSPQRKRPHGRPVRQLPGHRFLGYIQNHDQIGNRAAGERIGHLAGVRRARIGAAVVMTSPFVPLLFQGEEWAASTPFQYFTQHEDEELGRAVSTGRTGEFVHFGWNPAQVPDPQQRSTFERSKLRWDELTAEPHVGMLEWYRKLIALRRVTGNFTDGDLELLRVRFDENARWLVIERGPYSTVCNFAEDHRCVPVRPVAKILAASDQVEVRDCGVWMPDESVAIIQHSEVG